MELNPTPIPVVQHASERVEFVKSNPAETPTRANHSLKKRGLYFLCSVFVVRAEIMITLLMPSLSSILFRLFLFSIK
jgi:hypothetical protein